MKENLTGRWLGSYKGHWAKDGKRVKYRRFLQLGMAYPESTFSATRQTPHLRVLYHLLGKKAQGMMKEQK